MTLTVGSMFTGIGGLDLGLERAGMQIVWQAENDPYCTKILKRHWLQVPNLGDVTQVDWSSVPRVDLIAGGYPCQPFSLAGKRQGDRDPRHLWPHMLDAIRVLRPRYALLENVPGHLALGFGRVLGDLAEIGYDTEWDCIPAAAVGAPHLRWRVFVVAYPSCPRRRQDPGGASGDESEHAGRATLNDHVTTGDGEGSRAGHVADTAGVSGPDQSDSDRTGVEVGAISGPGGRASRGDTAAGAVVDRRGTGVVAPPVADTSSSGRRRSIDPEPDSGTGSLRPGQTVFGGRSRPSRQSWWDVEPDVGRVAHGIPHRMDRLRTLGNAVVPQIAQHIGQLILEASA